MGPMVSEGLSCSHFTVIYAIVSSLITWSKRQGLWYLGYSFYKMNILSMLVQSWKSQLHICSISLVAMVAIRWSTIEACRVRHFYPTYKDGD